jgi:hypothetical protein
LKRLQQQKEVCVFFNLYQEYAVNLATETY